MSSIINKFENQTNDSKNPTRNSELKMRSRSEKTQPSQKSQNQDLNDRSLTIEKAHTPQAQSKLLTKHNTRRNLVSRS